VRRNSEVVRKVLGEVTRPLGERQQARRDREADDHDRADQRGPHPVRDHVVELRARAHRDVAEHARRQPGDDLRQDDGRDDDQDRLDLGVVAQDVEAPEDLVGQPFDGLG